MLQRVFRGYVSLLPTNHQKVNCVDCFLCQNLFGFHDKTRVLRDDSLYRYRSGGGGRSWGPYLYMALVDALSLSAAFQIVVHFLDNQR